MNIAFHYGAQCQKYQFMLTQTERECDKNRRTPSKHLTLNQRWTLAWATKIRRHVSDID